MAFTEVNGVRLWYKETGEGEPGHNHPMCPLGQQSQPGQQADPFPDRRLEIQLAIHSARRDRGDPRADAGLGG